MKKFGVLLCLLTMTSVFAGVKIDSCSKEAVKAAEQFPKPRSSVRDLSETSLQDCIDESVSFCTVSKDGTITAKTSVDFLYTDGAPGELHYMVYPLKAIDSYRVILKQKNCAVVKVFADQLD